MPELPEVESYRYLAEGALGRVVTNVVAPDPWYLKEGLTASRLVAAVEGRSFTAARRVGKLLLLDTAGDSGDGAGRAPTVGLRFGMSGRLLVDGVAGVGRLVGSGGREEGAWDRVSFGFADGGGLVVRDPRRLGGVILDPDESRLGTDALAVTPAGLRRALEGSTAPLKVRLLDQSRLAGVGNLVADEVLYRAGLDPARPAGSLTPAEMRRLHRHLGAALADLMARGGSHTGDLHPARILGGRCPRDGTPLQRRTVGGRSTWSCPRHQR
ncbi:MAG: DNA-formamidopyrimidine glycosylase family protein [Acidimicrobiales bacterium]